MAVGGQAVVALQAIALPPIPQGEMLETDRVAEFVEILYGYKRRVTINPNSSIKHIREFLSSRITDDYLDDFVIYVTNYKVRENERAEEGGENLGVLHGTRKNVKQRRGAFSKNAKNTQKKDLAEDTPSQIDAALTPKEQVKRVGTQEAYDWIIARQSATLEKKFLAKLMDKNAEDDNEDDCVEIIDFMTKEGELLCLNTYECESLHQAYAANYNSMKHLLRGNHEFILARVKLVSGEIREVTPLIVDPARLQELLPQCSTWVKNHIIAARKKKEALRKLQDALNVPTKENKRKKGEKKTD